MPRATPEWIGTTPDTPAPPRVRARVFDAHGGVCYRTGRKIAAGERWELDHVVAIINGGENRESNLAPILASAHREKTAEDVDEKARIARKRAKHLGIFPKSRARIQSRGFPPTRGGLWNQPAFENEDAE